LKVGIYSSLGVKLFGLMSLLTILIVVATTFNSLTRLEGVLTDKIETQTFGMAKTASQHIESQIAQWVSLFAVATSTIKVVDDRVDPAQLQRLLLTNADDFTGIQVFTVKDSNPETPHRVGIAFTNKTDHEGFGENSPNASFDAVSRGTEEWIKSKAGKMEIGSIYMQNLSKQTSLRLANIAVALRPSGSSETVVTVLTVWQKKLIQFLESGKDLKTVLIDKTGRIFSSPSFDEMENETSIANSPLVGKALRAKSGSGAEPDIDMLTDYKYAKGLFVGAYARIPKFDGLTVVVQRDRKKAYATLEEARAESGLWGVLFFLVAIMLSFLGASQITKGLVQVTKATNRIASGDFSFRLQPKTRDEVGMLGHAVNTMSERIVGLMKTQVDKAKIEQELETAKMVQSTFFPKHDIKAGPVKLAGFYQPATQCGGDLWGHFTVRPGVELAYIADAMGHGAPAALVTAMAYSTCMTISDLMRDNPHLSGSPAKLLDRMNRIILEAVGGTISMTAFVVLIDTNTGKMTYSNAGHNFPAIIPLNADDPRSKKKKDTGNRPSPISLQLRGVPLGIDTAAEFTEKTIDLVAGDRIFMFTDGLIECSSPQGTVWGRKIMLEEIVEVATSVKDCGAAEMRNEITRRAFSFFGAVPLADDVTVLVIELDKNWVALSLPEPDLAPNFNEAPSSISTVTEVNEGVLSAMLNPSPSLLQIPDAVAMPVSNSDSMPVSLPPPPPQKMRPPAPDLFTAADAAILEPVFKMTEDVHAEVKQTLLEIPDTYPADPTPIADNLRLLKLPEEMSSLEIPGASEAKPAESPGTSIEEGQEKEFKPKRKFKITLPA
jgi:serine phosphatase RsbU (regulator of sigma subunit)